jgi:hypothetical protein
MLLSGEQPMTRLRPFTETVHIHDNTWDNNGYAPRGSLDFGPETLEDILWDGYYDPEKDNSDNSLSLCIDEESATFRNINVGGGFQDQPHTCTNAPIPPYQLSSTCEGGALVGAAHQRGSLLR